MALERRNPLPTGHYWIDVFGPKVTAMLEWLGTHRGKVVVLKTTTIPAGNGYVEGQWLLFRVDEPVPWDAVALGYPTIASATTQKEDTVQRPDPEPLFPSLSPSVPLWAIGGFAALLAAMLWRRR